MAKIVNVLLHGIFGYVFGKNHIEVYVPAVCGHVYKAGRASNGVGAQQLCRTEYTLAGVHGGSRVLPDCNVSPVLSLPPKTVIDEFGKRYCKIHLPYPAPFPGCKDQMCAVDRYKVGSIYAGRDAGPLNKLKSFPNMHIFVYELRGDSLKLENLSGGEPIDLTNPTGDVINVHIWCTTPPMDMDTHGSTRAGHLRKGFAALVDMFPTHEITLQIPDGFTPAADTEALPDGVGKCDVDPGRAGCAHFGEVNCGYANIMFDPTEARA